MTTTTAAGPQAPSTVRWVSPLLYLAAIGVLYVNNLPQFMQHWQWALQLVLAPCVIAAVLLRVRFPYALAILGILATLAGTTSVFLVGMISLAVRRTGPLVWVVAAAGGAVAAVQLTLRDASGSPPTAEVLAFALLGFFVFGLAPTLVGRYVQAHRRLEASVAERAVRAELDRELASRQAAQNERERIARDMHDSLGHVLALLTMQAGALEMSAKDPEVAASAEAIRVTARTGLADLRAVVRALGEDDRRDPAPGLAAIPQLVEASRSAGATVGFLHEIDEHGARLPASLGRVLYTLVQEGLTNAHRHAPGVAVDIALSGRPGDGVEVTISNQLGPGGERGAGTGLDSLRNRVQLLGGAFEARATRGRFELHAHLPWEDS
ncbi:MAG: histidine kinase [Propioniciclava sp.]|uniref:sensor histidine kinase n=1 Tax=Propioniciclava sp. TaxID=2038686 RepID=UPI0039E2A8ED